MDEDTIDEVVYREHIRHYNNVDYVLTLDELERNLANLLLTKGQLSSSRLRLLRESRLRIVPLVSFETGLLAGRGYYPTGD